LRGGIDASQGAVALGGVALNEDQAALGVDRDQTGRRMERFVLAYDDPPPQPAPG